MQLHLSLDFIIFEVSQDEDFKDSSNSSLSLGIISVNDSSLKLRRAYCNDILKTL
jgi:hypothetical protein